MNVWMAKMENRKGSCEKEVYYVYGSGFFPVPKSRINEIPRLKVELHSAEVQRGMVIALALKLA